MQEKFLKGPPDILEGEITTVSRQKIDNGFVKCWICLEAVKDLRGYFKYELNMQGRWERRYFCSESSFEKFGPEFQPICSIEGAEAVISLAEQAETISDDELNNVLLGRYGVAHNLELWKSYIEHLIRRVYGLRNKELQRRENVLHKRHNELSQKTDRTPEEEKEYEHICGILAIDH